jgi:adenosylcobyric acid synthase
MLPRISNFTDVDALFLEPDLDVEFVRDHRALAAADVVASWESVDLLRHDQSLDRAAAGAVVAHGLRALFGGRP